MSKRKCSSRSSSKNLRDNGIQAFRSGNYGVAIECWEFLRKRNSSLSQESALAEAYFRQGLNGVYDTPARWEDGLLYFSEAVTLQPDEARYHYYKGLASYELGNLAQAADAYAKAYQLGGPFGRRAAYALALIPLQQGEDPTEHPSWPDLTDGERATLTDASNLQRRPYSVSEDAPPLWYGVVALDNGELDEARRALEKVLETARNRGSVGLAHHYLGVLAARREDMDTARYHWNQALAAGFDAPHLTLNLGESYHRLTEAHLKADNPAAAAEAAREALHYKPGKRNLELALSQAYQRLGYQAAAGGRWEEARDYWQRAYRLEDGSFRLSYNLALACEKAGEYIEAAEKWRETLRRRPRRDDDPDAMDDTQVAQLWKRAAEAYVKAGEYDEAIHVYRQAVSYNPDNLETRMALVDSLQDNGQFQAAINELDRILEANPEHIPALMRMGEVWANSRYWWQGGGAVQYWERVLELDPNHHGARQALFDHWMNQAEDAEYWNSYEAAERFYKEALTYMPDHPEVLSSLGALYLTWEEEEDAKRYFQRAMEHAGQALKPYQLIISAWLVNLNEDAAWDVVNRVEEKVDDIPFSFYVTLGAFCIELDQREMAKPWFDYAVEKAPPEEAPLLVIGDFLIQTQAHDLARDYLQKAVDAGQAPGYAHMSLGVLDTVAENDRGARMHWRKAKRIANRNRDDELLEHIQRIRQLFSLPPYLRSLVMSGASLPFDPFEMLDEDEEFFDDEFGF